MPEPTIIRLPFECADHGTLAGAFIAQLVEKGIVFSAEYSPSYRALVITLTGGF